MQFLKLKKKRSVYSGQIVDTLWPSMTREILGENGIVNGDKQTHATIKRLVLRVFSPKFMGKYAPVVQHGISSHIKVRSFFTFELLCQCDFWQNFFVSFYKCGRTRK